MGKKDGARKWMWIFLAAVLAVQLYFVRELLAALLLFTVGFAALAGLAMLFFLLERVGQASMAWAGPRKRVVVDLTRRGFAVLEAISKKPLRRPRSETAQ
jgi:hypothetical protein